VTGGFGYEYAPLPPEPREQTCCKIPRPRAAAIRAGQGYSVSPLLGDGIDRRHVVCAHRCIEIAWPIILFLHLSHVTTADGLKINKARLIIFSQLGEILSGIQLAVHVAPSTYSLRAARLALAFVSRRTLHDDARQGSISGTPQSSNPPMSRVTTPAPLARATAAIMRSSGAARRPARRRAAKMSA
jgi:hypothetical protein